jgi:hypothetical protein
MPAYAVSLEGGTALTRRFWSTRVWTLLALLVGFTHREAYQRTGTKRATHL